MWKGFDKMRRNKNMFLLTLQTASCVTLASCMMFATSFGVTAQDMVGSEPLSSDTAAADIGVADNGSSENKANTVSIVCLASNVKAGARIKEEDVELKEVKAHLAPSNSITDITTVISKYATDDLYKGEYVYEAQLSSTKPSSGNSSSLGQSDASYVNVADYIKPNTGRDVYSSLNALIKSNPQRTIYFADGEYIISKPIKISASPGASVTLRLSEGAVIKAASSWNDKDAMICFGHEGKGDGVGGAGKYVGIVGGTIDGNGVANGIAIGKIYGFREGYVRSVLVKNAPIGITVSRGGNENSADVDIDDVVVVGTGKTGSIGIWLDSLDNTVTNARIYHTQIGVKFGGAGNLVRSIQVYNTAGLNNSIGFLETTGINCKTGYEGKSSGNFILHCRAIDYNVGIQFYGDITILDSCTAKWTKAISGERTAFKLNEKCGLTTASLLNCRAEFYNGGTFFSENTGGWITGNNFETPMSQGGDTSKVGSIWGSVLPIS